MAAAWKLIKLTVDEWQRDEAPRMGASLAYYALFSLAPLLVIVIVVIGFRLQGRYRRSHSAAGAIASWCQRMDRSDAGTEDSREAPGTTIAPVGARS